MVSGFFTSPCDHSRIFSGDASEIRIALNESGSLGFSKKLKMSRIGLFLFLTATETSSEKLLRRRGLSLFRGVLCALVAGLDQLDVQTESLELLDENVEALGQTRLQVVLALDDGLVHARAALHVVTLHGQKLLE